MANACHEAPGVSVDGFIADPDGGCDDLFGFYDNGDVELVLAAGWPAFHMDEPSATLMREAVARIGCHVMGRDLYDLTNGWNGHPGNEAPIVVLTHTPRTRTPRAFPTSSSPTSRPRSPRPARWPATSTS